MPLRRLLLASASPRRADLLRRIGLDLEVRPARVDETPRPRESPEALVERLARAKALALDDLPSPALIVAADTIVVLNGRILSKPGGPREARGMLARLAGRTHRVISGLAVRAHPEGELRSEVAVSRVTFSPMSGPAIDWYASTGEGLDKAGAYALQGIGSLFISAIEGSYTNVIGLPLERLYPHLQRFALLP
ncbi:MAG: Maf family protein [Acidobacteriota bacterium]